MTMSSNLATAIQMIGEDVKALSAGGDPSGPLLKPKNNIVAILGDSFTNQCTGANGTETYGYLSNALRQSEARFVFPLSNNFGVGGDTTTQIRERVPAVIASGAGIVIMLGGTNDRTSGLSVETSMDNYLYMRDTFIAAGVYVIAMVPTPRGDQRDAGTISKILTVPQQADAMRFRSRILNEMPKPGCTTVDAMAEWADPLSTQGESKQEMTHDGLHPGPTGAYHLGLLIAARIKEVLFYTEPIFAHNNADAYHATDNPFGRVSVNPQMVGTAGTPATGGSGQLADGWRGSTAGTAAGVTRTYSKQVIDGLNWQQVVLGGVTPSGAGRLDVLLQLDMQTNMVVGGTYEVVGRYQVDAGSQYLLSVQAGIQYNAFTTLYDGDRYDADEYFPTVAQAGIFRSPRITITDTPTDVRLLVSCYVSNLGPPVATMRFREVALRRVYP